MRRKGRSRTPQKGSGIAGNIQPNRAIAPHRRKHPPERHAKSGVQRLCKHSPGVVEKGPQRRRSFFTIPLCPSHFLTLLVATLDECRASKLNKNKHFTALSSLPLMWLISQHILHKEQGGETKANHGDGPAGPSTSAPSALLL